MNPSPITDPSSLSLPEDVVLSVRGVSKKFCRNLKRSMLYGMQDLARNMLGMRQPKMTSDESSVMSESQHIAHYLPLFTTDLRPSEFWALQDINFNLKRGECLGLIGANGSGKSTLLRVLTGIFPPDNGVVAVRGRIGALIALGAGFHPHMTGRENIYLNGAILGMKKTEIDHKINDIINFAEIGEFIDAPVSTYSSGMNVRLGFSIAVQVEPDLLVLDEVLAVGDVGFRAKCYQRIGELIERTAVVFVTHDIIQVSRICDKVMVLDKGKPVYLGETEAGVEEYLRISTGHQAAKERTVLDGAILAFSCSVNMQEVKYGQTLGLHMTFDSICEVMTGLCLVAISATETYYAQSDFSALLPVIPKGRSSFVLQLGPVCLRKDAYRISVTILRESRKATIVHAINCAKFSIGGRRGFGVAYQMPVAISGDTLDIK